MAKLKDSAPDEMATAKKVSRNQGGRMRIVGKKDLASVDVKRLDEAERELAQARKQERGLKKRISGIVRGMNMITNTYRGADEMFVRYLPRDKALVFRGRGGNGKAS